MQKPVLVEHAHYHGYSVIAKVQCKLATTGIKELFSFSFIFIKIIISNIDVICGLS